MKVVILAGGFGTRLSEETTTRPKPMVEIGEKPILWHVMKIYSYYGFNEFIICCGYKQQMIKEWFADYYLQNCDVTFDFANGNDITIHKTYNEPWKVTVVDTGLKTMTGGRIKRIRKYVGTEAFLMTYGDGVSDVDINKLVKYHIKSGKLATMTAVNTGQRFGVLELNENNEICAFREKSLDDGSLINAGFMVLEPEVFDYILDDYTVFEKEPLERLALEGQLMAYKHKGFWRCMDSQRDRDILQHLWDEGQAPWKLWS